MNKVASEIVEQIRKILSRTEKAGCTPAEAEAALAMASRKLAEHNLTMDDVEVGDSGEDSWLEEAIHTTGRWSLEDNLCYGILKNHFFVEGILTQSGGRRTFKLFGKPENVATARHVWVALHSAFAHHWAAYRAATGAPSSDKRAFVAGMAKGFSEKLNQEREAQAIERDIVQGTTGTALALASIADKVAQAFAEKYKSAKPRRGSSNYQVSGSKSSLQAGYETGKTLNLNRSVESKKRKEICG